MFDKITELENRLTEKRLEKTAIEKQIAEIENEIRGIKNNCLIEQIKSGENKDVYAICVSTAVNLSVWVKKVIFFKDGSAVTDDETIDSMTFPKVRGVIGFREKIKEYKANYNSNTLFIQNLYDTKFISLYDDFEKVYPLTGGKELKKRVVRCISVRRNTHATSNNDGYFINIEDVLIRGSYDGPDFDITTKRVQKIYSEELAFKKKPVNQPVDDYVGDAIITLRDEYGELPVLVSTWNANDTRQHFNQPFTFGNENNHIERRYMKELEEYIQKTTT